MQQRIDIFGVDIAREHGDIGALAGDEAAAIGLRELGIGAGPGVGVQSFGEADALVGAEHGALDGAAGDEGVQVAEWVGGGDRRV